MQPDEWNKIAADYEERVKSIRIMPTADQQDIRNLVSSIDAVLTKAMFDLTRATNAYELLAAQCTTTISELALQGKSNGMSDERAKNYARVEASKIKIIDRKLEAQRRMVFMQNVVDLLKAKHDLLLIDYGILKTEAGLAR